MTKPSIKPAPKPQRKQNPHTRNPKPLQAPSPPKRVTPNKQPRER